MIPKISKRIEQHKTGKSLVMALGFGFAFFRDFTNFIPKFIKVGCLALNNTTNENKKILNDACSIITVLYTKFGDVRVHFDSFVVPKTQKSILIPSFSIYCIICPVIFKNLYNNDNFLIKNFLEEQLNNLIQIEIFLNDKEEEKKKSKKK